MHSKELTFENERGETLAARLDVPVDEAPVACALFAHCFTCTKNLEAVTNISYALTRQGIAVLRFDFTGLGESEGDFEDTNFSSNVDDLVAAAAFMEREVQAPEILVGHSLGGAAALMAAPRIASVQAVATIGAPADPDHVTGLLEDSVEDIERTGRATVRLAGRSFTITKQFLDDLRSRRTEEAIGKLKRALLIFHAPVDDVVGIDNAARIFKAAKHPKSFVSLDRADHLLTDPADSHYVGGVLAAWARRYVGISQEEIKYVDPGDNHIFAEIGRDHYETTLNANGHTLVADEPRSVGGTNRGPSPYDLLAAALGACTAMTLRMYADRKQWPLEGVKVRLRHEKIHAEDCEHCQSEKGKVDRIWREVESVGPLDDRQRARLLEIANRCPVHRTLAEGEVDVVTREMAPRD